MPKSILITGCSSGIGKALATQMATHDYKVFAGVRNPDSIRELESDNFIPIELDVNNEEHIRNAVEIIESSVGKLDCLVNNAGYGAMGPMMELPVQDLVRQFETNTFAPIALAQAMLPLLLKSKNPIISNVASSASYLPTPFSGAYTASKMAIASLSETMLMELKPLGIHVMTVWPGAIASSFGSTATDKLADSTANKSMYADVMDQVQKRANSSQYSPTSADKIVDGLVKALKAKRPPINVRIGYGSSILPFLGKLPKWYIRFIMNIWYHLYRLKKLTA